MRTSSVLQMFSEMVGGSISGRSGGSTSGRSGGLMSGSSMGSASLVFGSTGRSPPTPLSASCYLMSHCYHCLEQRCCHPSSLKMDYFHTSLRVHRSICHGCIGNRAHASPIVHRDHPSAVKEQQEEVTDRGRYV
jgi:hypothetical protein